MVKKLLICIGIFISIESVQAQYTSRLGRFQVDQIRGCAPFTITITNTNLITVGECTPGKPCLMDFQGTGTQQQNQFTFTYATPGSYKLSVLYQSIGADDITITVDPYGPPTFEVYTCSASQVSIKVTDKNYDSYAIDFGDGSAIVQIPSSNNQIAQHAYPSNANYIITVKGKKINAANNCNATSHAFQAITALPVPQVKALIAIDASTLKLDFTPQANVQYKLEIAINSTNFQQFQTLYGVNTTTFSSLRLDDNYYCFRLGSYDACTGVNNYSPLVCSHNFDLTIASDVNKLNWITSGTGVTSIDVLRDKGVYTTIPGAPVAFSDVDVKCNVTYCYQVRSNYSGAISTSLEKCGKAFTTIKPTKITNTSSVVSEKGVQLSWIQDPLFKVTSNNILRSTDKTTFFPLGTSTTAKYLDQTYATAPGYCYKINYVDECNNKSNDSDIACPIQLLGTLNDRNEITLIWTDYTGWTLGVKNYVVEKYDKNGIQIKSYTTGTLTTLIDDLADPKNQIVGYRIVAMPNETTLVSSVSNLVNFTKEVNLFYPTSFTPDKQGPVENEVFNVNGQFIVKLELSIFDRWGAQIFYSSKNEPWDGTQGGQPMPIASYVWTANITDLAGRSLKRSGTVVLLRK